MGTLLLFLLGCLQLTFADVSSAIPATYIRSSVDGQGSAGLGGSFAKTSYLCGNLEPGCKVDRTTEFPRRLPFSNHLLEKRSSYELQSLPDTVLAAEANDGLRQLETASGYREGGTSNQVNRPAVNRPIWNVPFRVFYGSGRNPVKFGKRSFADGFFDGYSEGRFKFGKRSKDAEKRMFKFGKREDGFSDDQNLSSAEDKRLFKFGKRTDDLQDDPNLEIGEEKRMFKFGKRTENMQDDPNLDTVEEKRMFKFGKRADDWSGDSKFPAGEEKRMFKFGKRFDRFENSAGDEKRMFKFGKRLDDPQSDQNLEKEEEKRKFSFGKRTYDVQVARNHSDGEEARMLKLGEWTKSLPEVQNLEESEVEKRMIKFGKKANEFNEENQSKLGADTKGLVQSPEDGKRILKFGKKSDSIDEGITHSEGKRKILFGKREETIWDKEQQNFDEGLNSMETDKEELPQEKRRPKFQFGRRLAPRPEDLSAKVRSKFKLGKRSA